MNILTEGGRYNLVGLLIVIQFYQLQVIQHLLLGQIGSQQGVDLVCVKLDSGGLALSVVYIYHAVYHFAGPKLLDKLAGTVDGCLGIVRIQALFELTGSICTKSDTLCGKTNVHAVEAGCLEQHSLYIIGNHRILAAHDTCDANCFLAVTDHQDIFIHGTLLAVQSHELLTLIGAAYQNLMTGNGVQVVSVHGLTILFHDIVGDIDDVVNRTDTIDCQSALHPLG